VYTTNYVHAETPKNLQMTQTAQAQSASAYGPSLVMNLELIRQSLRMPHLSAEGVLSLASDAMFHGQKERINYNGQSFLRLARNQMVFTLSYDCTTVHSIEWMNMETIFGYAQTSPMNQTNHAVLLKSNSVRRETSPTPSTSSLLSLGGKMVEESSPEWEQLMNGIVDELDEFIMDNEVTRGYRSGTGTPSVTPCSSQGNSWGGLSSLQHASKCGVAPRPPLICIPSTEEVNHCSLRDVMHLSPSVQVTVPTALFVELRHRFGTTWESLAHLTQNVQHVINSVPGQDVMGWKMWTSSPLVFVMDRDGCTLADVFEERYFQLHYEHCLRSLAQRKQMNTVVAATGYDSAQSTPPRGPMTVASNAVNAVNAQNVAVHEQQKRVYHLIYIKPIMERLSAVTGCSTINESFVTQIVDAAIQYGAKRQISKRTFEFKWQRYTVIMSKSLRTILDVAVSANEGATEVISVHPDVVSILAKKCPVLDYFTIQRLAGGAKQTSRFSAKKNEYRQQFTYEFAGCRIVFASNHSTIVEMQCHDLSALSTALSTCTSAAFTH